MNKKFIIIFLFLHNIIFASDNITLKNLLIKIPTRGRPDIFFKNLDLYYSYLSLDENVHFLISLDEDDLTMNNDLAINKLRQYSNLSFTINKNKSKVDAYNAGLIDNDFDIVMLGSDNKTPLFKNYDKIIIEKMNLCFPDSDGIINFYQGNKKHQTNCLKIVGRKFFDRFNYVYNPIYKSSIANEELLSIAKILKKCEQIKISLFNYEKTSNKTDLNYKNFDLNVFKERRQKFYDLSQDELNQSLSKKWSVLICTLDERIDNFNRLYNKLLKQIHDNNLEDEVEILYFRDNRENTIGFKRNALLEASSGMYTNFLDDDDEIHDNYVKMIYEGLKTNPDCVKVTGIITTKGMYPTKFILSKEYIGRYGSENGAYIRPPNHLNPIKRSIACQFTYLETNFGEDKDWSIEMSESGLLNTEYNIEEPYYFYLYDGKYN